MELNGVLSSFTDAKMMRGAEMDEFANVWLYVERRGCVRVRVRGQLYAYGPGLG